MLYGAFAVLILGLLKACNAPIALDARLLHEGGKVGCIL